MLEIKNLNKTFHLGIFGNKTIQAAENISFKIKKGEIVSLIGESGSGKSTIGHMILKLLQPTSGDILYEGKSILDLKRNALKDYYYKVQGVFQDPFSSFNPIFKADRIFSMIHKEFYPEISQSTWNRKVHDALQTVGLEAKEVLGKFAHQLSGGQLQRFLIARALILNVKFLVADEIISMLDASTRIDILNLLGELRKKGLSILFITHDLNLGYYISDSVVIMYKGSVVEMGETKEVYHSPLHPYTQMLLDSVPRLDKLWGKPTPLTKNEIISNELNRCKYYDRCVKYVEGCSQTPLIQVKKDHHVACFNLKK